MLRDGIKQNWPEVVSQKVQRYTGVGFVHITVKENTGGLTTTSLAKLISQYLSHVSLHVLASSPAVCWMSSWAGGSGGRKEKGASSLAANEKVKMPVSWNKFLRFFFFFYGHTQGIWSSLVRDINWATGATHTTAAVTLDSLIHRAGQGSNAMPP